MGILRGYGSECQFLSCIFAHFFKANVLVNQQGNACLADFGLLTIISDPTNPTTSSSSTEGGTTRWMSPELLDPERFGFKDSQPTIESDCYALGMVIYEVLSGQAPFTPYVKFTVMRKVTDGERPVKPEGENGVWFTDDLWGMLEQCWAPQSKNRPSIEAVLECLGPISKAWRPPSQIGGDFEMGEDDWCLTPLSEFSGMVSFHFISLWRVVC
jgi:serine/threonine protein kinase